MARSTWWSVFSKVKVEYCFFTTRKQHTINTNDYIIASFFATIHFLKGECLHRPFTQHCGASCARKDPAGNGLLEWRGETDGQQQPRRDVFEWAAAPGAANKKLFNPKSREGTKGQTQGESSLIHSAAGWEPTGQQTQHFSKTTRGKLSTVWQRGMDSTSSENQ